MAVGDNRRAVGTFADRASAEQALTELRDSGFPMDRVSIIHKGGESEGAIAGTEVQDKPAQEGAGVGAVTGTVLGGIGGLLVGLEAILIPGAGPFLAAGTIATTLAGAGIGAAGGGLIGALVNLGIPEDRATLYNEQLSSGGYLVLVEGSDDEIHRAEMILQQRHIQDWGVYDIPTSSTAGVATSGVSPGSSTMGSDRDMVEVVDKRNP